MTELGKKNLYPGMRQQIIGTAEDITEHRQANEKLRQGRRQFRELAPRKARFKDLTLRFLTP
jgi:hypothetical protein